ncbi:sigma-54-dependent transcriptional regulator [Colwellia psychrerythraea]|uniref:Sigma-54 dependent DNA-binding response regulator, Fis family n=1 Tax=Colwellia psychrerythraea (strain 34H / ATCC BAA-681) TaxID=167879 RepID=Q483C0_COLP3|nr:sigma-54 dependent transcriptional regulator [Colwellia psychrerythraea]AAZ26475.1 sigma-54 dependent DNA-binding response regulator, Fis family [Colwellia psychrerythraea 34H]
MNKNILLVDDDLDILSALKILLVPEGYGVNLCQTPSSALAAIKKTQFDLVLMDLNYSLDTTSGEEGLTLIADIRKLEDDLPIVVMTGWATVEVAVSTMQNGANDFVQKPWDIERLISIINNQLKLASSEKNSQRLTQQNQLLQQRLDSEFKGEIISQSPVMQKALVLIEQVAQSHACILLTGENGTGKSMFARYIHQHSNRKDANQISVNMGAVSETLFESEMFGHVKGAFTDAKSTRIGRFELADGGSLFLDEIANTPYSQQAKLLRVLEDQQFEKVGASKTQSVDVRLICATNANLNQMVAAGEFRKDLLYRINTIAIEIPALRHRKEDIVLLADAFLTQWANKYGRNKLVLDEQAKNALVSYDWPGNIRELNHVLERAQILCQGVFINVNDLGLSVNTTQTDTAKVDVKQGEFTEKQTLDSLADLELTIIDQRLKHFDGNVLKAAKSLGLSRSALYRRLDKI